MSAKRAVKKTTNEVAKDILFALLGAFQEVVLYVDRPLTDPELYALMSAFKEAKPHLDKKDIVDFAAAVLRRVDLKAVRAGKDEYAETFDSFIELLVS